MHLYLKLFSVSLVAGLINVQDSGNWRSRLRKIEFCLFFLLYISFSIVFGKTLELWDDNTPGRCYRTRFISKPGHSHPYVDKVYLGITCFFCVGTMTFCGWKWTVGNLTAMDRLQKNLGFTLSQILEDWWPQILEGYFPQILGFPSYHISTMAVVYALLQYPLHLYMVIAMRVSNKGFVGDGSESAWGFGQIMALILALTTLLECIGGAIGEFRGLSLRETSYISNLLTFRVPRIQVTE